MHWREFIALLGAVASRPHSLLARGAQGAKPFRIVTLPDIHPSVRDVFIDAMRQLGWIEGRLCGGHVWIPMGYDGWLDDVRRIESAMVELKRAEGALGLKNHFAYRQEYR